MTKKTTGKLSHKPYQCAECGKERELQTNHWGECYPWCTVCEQPTTHKCLEEAPEGYGTPEPWKTVKLGDIADVS
jgi:hypothetical protein